MTDTHKAASSRRPYQPPRLVLPTNERIAPEGKSYFFVEVSGSGPS